MAISNLSDFKDAGQETYQTAKTWTLTEGDPSASSGQVKTVYVKFYTQYGQPSKTVSDTIVLDTQAPEEEEITIAELQGQIAEILAQINPLQVQLDVLRGEVAYEGIPADFTFEKNLSVGMSDPDVVYLKIVLDAEVDHAEWTGTEYFGSKTKTAVVVFQTKYHAEISEVAGYDIAGTGFVGTGTRTKLNEILVAKNF